LPSHSFGGHHHVPCNRVGVRSAEVPPHKGETQIRPGRAAGTRCDVALVDVKNVGIDVDPRECRGQPLRMTPMGGCATPIPGIRPSPSRPGYVRAHISGVALSVSDFDPVSAWAALLRTYAAVLPKVERALAPTGMPLTWYDVLLVVNAAPGRRLRMTELGRQAVVSRERVSRVVTELELAGLVLREANPDDKRSSFAVITRAGRQRLRAAAPIYLQAIREHFLARLSDEEARVIARALSRIVDAEKDSTSS
jgi:DNA-binding MarR family transcriptional regulator